MIDVSPDVRAREALAGVLDSLVLAGIDAVVEDRPRDRLAETAAETGARAARARPPAPMIREGERETSAPGAGQPSAETAAPPAPAGRVVVPDEIAIADARERARSASTLAELEAALQRFEGCNLRLTARSLVFGDGAADARLMLVGEAPGRDEDVAGVPFVGKSGQLLDRMLAAVGIERSQVRVTNTVPWRPPGNRTPTPAETEICLPFLARHIELVRPRIIACLGSPSAKALLRTEDGILRLRGRWQSYSFGVAPEDTIPVLPMLHPAYLLRQPAQKKLAWRDWLALKQKLDELG